MKRLAPLIALLLLVARAGAVPVPGAGSTIVRGGRGLADLLLSATGAARGDAAGARAVAIVVDVTPNTRAAADGIAAALEAVGDATAHLDGAWRVGLLGGKLGPASRHPSRLALEVPDVLAAEIEITDTIRALGRSLADFTDPGGLVVYLADWHFEDDEGLEGLVSRLSGRRQVFTTIGSEAAFDRGWTDPFASGMIMLSGLKYEEGVGRSPFGRNPDGEPWHGGDTAFPHHPYVFGTIPWRSTFPLRRSFFPDRNGEWDRRPEDLSERIRSFRDESSGYLYPLASSWGPYGLMRLAAETGGKYYLHSFNPQGRTDLTYDYSRCNLFAPDLRSRREILGDVRGHPLVSALARAWNRIAGKECGLIRATAPVSAGGASDDMSWVDEDDLSIAWLEESEHDAFLRTAERWVREADEAIRILDRALAAGPDRDAPYARYRADADYFRHVLACLRFQLAEALAVARTVPADAWDDEETFPGLRRIVYLPEERDPELVRPVPGVQPRDREAGERVAAERADRLRRYGGTPFGETVARNEVVTWRLVRVPRPEPMDTDGIPPGLTPSESGGDRGGTPTPRPRPRPGGSSGGGPSSGR